MTINSGYTISCFVSLTLLFCCMAGCSEVETDSTGNEEWKLSSFQLSGLSAMHQDASLPPLHAYVFVEDVLEKVHNNLIIGTDETVDIPYVEGGTVYFFSGPDAVGTNLDGLVEGRTSLHDFLNLRTPALEASTNHPDIFYSGKATGKEVSLTPGVARINLKIKNNADIKVTKIILYYTSESVAIFSYGSPAVQQGDNRTIEFPEGSTGEMENICQLYETTRKVQAYIYALYNGSPSVRTVYFPQHIQRGYQYTLTLTDVGTTVEGTIQTDPWTDGGIIEATPE
ncbi:hypothetical protein [Bacteroides fragilis]|uniref:hypothetical protein n=1 Tax=Bacteroides fragilis TaxID=817 RepID=UPI0022AA7CBD|nr:hypothetical protein [Bacteroides fragilis]MCZ2530979.1 hypothetical protein [Bacteroides fragilis]